MDSPDGLEVIRGRITSAGGALHLDDGLALLPEAVPAEGCDIALDVAFAGAEGFAGIAFAARDAGWHELVYLSPSSEVQYDPVMNGSNTWQLYPDLRATASGTGGSWRHLHLQVRPGGVAAFVDGATAPTLVVRPLRTGSAAGRVGIWGYLPCAVRGLRLAPANAPLPLTAPDPPLPRGTLAAWRLPSGSPVAVEANGVLNLNRHLRYAPGAETEVRAVIVAPVATDACLKLGYSDRLRLWLNGALVHEGLYRWDPPRGDGRVLPATVALPARLRAGVNEVVARVAAEEAFGWGLSVSARWPAPAAAS